MMSQPLTWSLDGLANQLRGCLTAGHCEHSCHYDSPVWRCSACSAGALLARSDRSDRAEDPGILIVRHQVAVLQRQVKVPRLSGAGRAVLAALARLLPGSQLRQPRLIISPADLLRWHAGLVRAALGLRTPSPANGPCHTASSRNSRR